MLPKDFIKRGARVWAVIPEENGTWGTIKSVGRKYIVVDNKKFHIDTHRQVGDWECELYSSPEAYIEERRGECLIEELRETLSHPNVTAKWFGGINKLIKACEIMGINTDNYP